MLTLALVLGLLSAAIVLYLVFLIFFERGLDYRIEKVTPAPIASREFACVLSSIADAELHHGSRIEALCNGDALFGAQLEAIRGARSSVHLEQYIFRDGVIGRRFVEALVERARAGVKVRLTLDYAGSLTTKESMFRELREAGGQIVWYQPPRWYTFKHFNNRTHRKILVVDGRVGFVGGAGVSDEWLLDAPGRKRWRDTMFRIEGRLVSGLQTAFLENWIESAGEILIDPAYFAAREMGDESIGDSSSQTGAQSSDHPSAGVRSHPNDEPTAGLVVISSPGAGRSTRAHVVYQALIAAARRSLEISTPYFLPDEATYRGILAALDRGVRVRIVTAGAHTDHALSRISGRGRYAELLRRGAEIYEYRPAMLHTKALVIDGTWCVVGSANLDNRSFALNDEVFVCARDPQLAERVMRDLADDIRESERVTMKHWRARGVAERVLAPMVRLLDRQT